MSNRNCTERLLKDKPCAKATIANKLPKVTVANVLFSYSIVSTTDRKSCSLTWYRSQM